MNIANLESHLATLDVWFDPEKRLYHINSKKNNKRKSPTQMLNFFNSYMSVTEAAYALWYVSQNRRKAIDIQKRKR
jgi:hypothetical protein